MAARRRESSLPTFRVSTLALTASLFSFKASAVTGSCCKLHKHTDNPEKCAELRSQQKSSALRQTDALAETLTPLSADTSYLLFSDHLKPFVRNAGI